MLSLEGDTVIVARPSTPAGLKGDAKLYSSRGLRSYFFANPHLRSKWGKEYLT